MATATVLYVIIHTSPAFESGIPFRMGVGGQGWRNQLLSLYRAVWDESSAKKIDLHCALLVMVIDV